MMPHSYAPKKLKPSFIYTPLLTASGCSTLHPGYCTSRIYKTEITIQLIGIGSAICCLFEAVVPVFWWYGDLGQQQKWDRKKKVFFNPLHWRSCLLKALESNREPWKQLKIPLALVAVISFFPKTFWKKLPQSITIILPYFIFHQNKCNSRKKM